MRSQLLTLFSAITFLLSACSSAKVENSNTGSNSQKLENSGNTASGSQEIAVKNANTGERIAIPGINEPIENKNGEAINQKQPENVSAPAGKSAPDDSVFTTRLTDVGLETRTFKSEPQLEKVERITSAKGKTIKVYLRNGKVFELPGDQLQNLASIPASEILKAVGILPKQQPPLPPKSKDMDQKVQ